MKLYKTSMTVLLAYIVWSWSAVLASATWWLLTVPPAKENEQNRNSKDARAYCDSLRFLRGGQIEYCANHPTLMQKISDGVKAGIRECQYQFRFSRWNCTTYPGSPRNHAFKPIVKSPSPQAAYVHAIIAASITYEVTRACSVGDLPNECACARNRETSTTDWGGCTDDIRFGYGVSKDFLDSETSKNQLGKIVLHNREVGRRVVRNRPQKHCKCHGLSGTCTQDVCWKTMPSLRNVSRILKEKFDDAVAVKYNKRSKNLRPKARDRAKVTQNDLVYVDAKRQTDFCVPKRTQGSYGTKGRLCNATGNGNDNCDKLCCHRGSKTKQVTRLYDCNCTFEWCCELHCQRCSETVTESRCR